MEKLNTNWIILFAATALLGFGCAEQLETPTNGPTQVKDSGWLASDSFEVNAVVSGTVSQSATGEWSDIADDASLQAKLVDLQIKFIKNTAESNGWRFNQLADAVEVDNIYTDGDVTTIKYRAVVDMLGRLNGYAPTLDRVKNPEFDSIVPQFPGNIAYEDYKNCGETDDPSVWVRDYNFHYYFAPNKAECEMALGDARIQVTEVFERKTAYPEYDKLLQPLDGERLGFRAALVPNRGDREVLSRFESHAKMLERDLGLTGEDSEDGQYRRYEYNRGAVTIEIDLYYPNRLEAGENFASSFRKRLADYSFVHYNGHSSYGSKHLLDDPDAYSDDYQIIVLHSCQSYAYYTRQVFRGKATAADPQGFANADVVSTGKSSYPSGAPPTLEVLLSSLMDGLVAVTENRPEDAPDWLTISEGITDSTWGDILYGVAGVRTNAWQP